MLFFFLCKNCQMFIYNYVLLLRKTSFIHFFQQQAPRFEPQQVAPLPPPDVPGIEAHLAETAKIIALQQSQAKV